MFAYMKVPPTTYVLQYQGRSRPPSRVLGSRSGPHNPSPRLWLIPLASRDVPFAFNEVTADFQPVTLQGQLTYRVADPRPARRTAQLQRPTHRVNTSRTIPTRYRSTWCRPRRRSAEPSCSASHFGTHS